MKKTTFKTVAAAWDYLEKGGWIAGRSRMYEAVRKGHLARNPDGSVDRAAVDAYAATYCRRVDTGRKGAESVTVAEEREVVRLEREKVRLKKEQRELELIEGKAIPRNEVELMIVGRAVAFLSHLRAMTQMRAGDWIHIVNGDHSRAPELIAAVQDNIEEHIATFARDVEFKVMLLPAGDADEAHP